MTVIGYQSNIRGYLVHKDAKRRKQFANYEQKKKKLKYLILNTKNMIKKTKLLIQLRKMPKDSSITRMRNYCILTGKARSVYRDFRLSRHQIRRLASQGDLVGIRKSSW
jgi:small subunit ribosomal protein S14